MLVALPEQMVRSLFADTHHRTNPNDRVYPNITGACSNAWDMRLLSTSSICISDNSSCFIQLRKHR